MDLLADDNKLINLMTVFGNPFPKAKNTLALKSCDEDVWPLNNTKKSYSSNENSSDQTVEVRSAYMERDNEENVSTKERDKLSAKGGNSDQELSNNIQVFIELHEGQQTNSSPFRIHPKQMVSIIHHI